MWDKDSANRLLYVKRKDKYDFITKPEDYLVGFACKDTEYDELARRTLVQVCFDVTSWFFLYILSCDITTV